MIALKSRTPSSVPAVFPREFLAADLKLLADLGIQGRFVLDLLLGGPFGPFLVGFERDRRQDEPRGEIPFRVDPALDVVTDHRRSRHAPGEDRQYRRPRQRSIDRHHASLLRRKSRSSERAPRSGDSRSWTRGPSIYSEDLGKPVVIY